MSRLRGREVWIRLACALAIAAMGCGAFAASAGAFVYWTNESGPGGTPGTTIGRANLNGTGADQSFIGGVSDPYGVAVDSSHIYWTDDHSGLARVGRANLDGTGVDQDFITISGSAGGVAVDATHVYWGNAGGATIGRANLDGSSPDQSFITGASDPLAIAVDAGYIYWIDYRGPTTSTIGRANLDGSSPDQSFISGVDLPQGLAVNADYIYWANTGAGTIGRANLNGTGADQSFMTGVGTPATVAVDADHLYWTDLNTNTVGRANLNGTDPDPSFITGTDGPFGLAVDALSATSTVASDATARFSTAAQNVGLAAAVSSPDAVVNAGTVTFTVKQGATTVGSATSAPVTDGQASASYALPAGTPAGTYTIDATYVPGPDLTASSDTGHSLTIISTVPVDSTAPSISGAAQQGQTLTADHGIWTNNPTGYGYQWQICDTSGNHCTDIPGASGPTYTPTGSDVGHTLRVVVTAANAGGTASSASAPTAVVTAPPTGPRPPTPPVTVTGHSCPSASGRLHGSHLGAIRLGMTRAQLHRALPTAKVTHSHYLRICLAGGHGGLSVAFPTRRLLRALPRRERDRLDGRVMLALTANRHYALDGIRPAAPLRRVKRRLQHARHVRIGLTTWYFIRGRDARGVISVRHRVVSEVGIANSALTATRPAQRRLLTSLRPHR